MTLNAFQKYFSLEEAVHRLPAITKMADAAKEELGALQDSLTLTRRILLSKQDNGLIPVQEEVELLQAKYTEFETLLTTWVTRFAEQGVIFRDYETGLLDFPYYSETRQEDLFLCWRNGEDGIFYFHSISEGFSGRHPISLLPE